MNRIVVRSGDGAVVSELMVGALPVTIGRDADNDIVLDDRSVSRHHLKLEAGPDGARIVNLSKVSSMRVNGAKASILPICRRAEVEIAQYRVEISLEDALAPAGDPGVPGPPFGSGAAFAAEVPRRRSFAVAAADSMHGLDPFRTPAPARRPLADLPAVRVMGYQLDDQRLPSMSSQASAFDLPEEPLAIVASLLEAFRISEESASDEIPSLWPAFVLLACVGAFCQLLSLLFWEQSLPTLVAGAILTGPLCFALAVAIALPFALFSKIHSGEYHFRKLATVSCVILSISLLIRALSSIRPEGSLLTGALSTAAHDLCAAVFWFTMLRIAFSIQRTRALGTFVAFMTMLFFIGGLAWKVFRFRQPTGFALNASPIQVSRFARSDPESSNQDLQLALSRSLAKSRPKSRLPASDLP